MIVDEPELWLTWLPVSFLRTKVDKVLISFYSFGLWSARDYSAFPKWKRYLTTHLLELFGAVSQSRA